MTKTPNAITAACLITSTSILRNPLLLLHDGRIEHITTRDHHAAPERTLELAGVTMTAGFFDVHVHGAGGHDVMEGDADPVDAVTRVLAKFGTTSLLATTVTAPVDATLASLEKIAERIEGPADEEGARILGIHLEGPFLSHEKRGVHPPEHLQAASIELFDRFWQAARGHIRLMTVAPELPGALEMIAYATRLGVRVSIGHSNALAAQAEAGIHAGAVSATHTFNAMRPLDHREPGILGITLDRDTLYAELICDGIHTTPEAVRLWYRSKGPERAILITDGMAATGMPDGTYSLGGMDVEVHNGTCMHNGVLAGSVLTMDRAVSNMQKFTGAPLQDAVRLATRNPAAMTGLSTGDVVEGAPADLNLFGSRGSRVGTVLRGRVLTA